MRGESGKAAAEEQGEERRRYDPEAETKLLAAKGQIVTMLKGWRPRFLPLFELMKVAGSTISIASPSEDLKAEILRNEIELVGKIVKLAMLDGVVDLAISVDEFIESKRPVRLEDRIIHFGKVNPVLAELTEALDLQVDG
ncbi:MAG: DNA polymerase III subunit gamma/tau [Rikenellaceae bacterium]